MVLSTGDISYSNKGWLFGVSDVKGIKLTCGSHNRDYRPFKIQNMDVLSIRGALKENSFAASQTDRDVTGVPST